MKKKTNLKNVIRRIFAFAVTGVILASFVMMINTSKVKASGESCTIVKPYLDEATGNDTGLICKITLTGPNANRIESNPPVLHYLKASQPGGLYGANFGVGIWFDGIYDFDPNSEYTLTFYFPNTAIDNNLKYVRNDRGGKILSASVAGSVCTMKITNTKQIGVCFYYDDIDGQVITETEPVGDWLDPLRTQLAIAADPEIGKNVNNTAEYTGDFALPAEIMQFLKDHPEVTLKYTFDYKGETHTVVIPGKSVVIEEGVPWYGFENLLGRYGK